MMRHYEKPPMRLSEIWRTDPADKLNRLGYRVGTGNWYVTDSIIDTIRDATPQSGVVFIIPDANAIAHSFNPVLDWTNKGAEATEIPWEDVLLYLEEPEELEELFVEHAERWKLETLHLSSLTNSAMHPSYPRIIGLGKQVIPLILEDLEQEPNHWFWALNAITGENPAEHEYSVEGAARAWIEWGRERGYMR